VSLANFEQLFRVTTDVGCTYLENRDFLQATEFIEKILKNHTRMAKWNLSSMLPKV
jgi:hypothetical protein